MKKKLITGFLVAFCLVASNFLSTVLVKADVIWEPRNDYFYQDHKRDCKYESRDYRVKSSKGYTIAYVSPISSVDLRVLKNGEKIHVLYTYKDSYNKLWGMISEDMRQTGNYNETSWIRMDDLELVYDHEEFCKDHKDEITKLDDRFNNNKETVDVWLWTYPNSGETSGYIEKFRLGSNMGYLYTDEYGRTWSYMYYYQSMKGWICLDDPDNKDLASITPKPTASIEPSIVPTSSIEPTIIPTASIEPSIIPTSSIEPTIIPTASIEPTMVPTASPEVKKDLTCEFTTVNTWPGGFISQITIKNNTSMPIKNWEANFTTNYSIISLWGANLVSSEDGKYTVKNDTWDEAIEALQTKHFNFVVQNDYKEPITDIVARAIH